MKNQIIDNIYRSNLEYKKIELEQKYKLYIGYGENIGDYPISEICRDYLFKKINKDDFDFCVSKIQKHVGFFRRRMVKREFEKEIKEQVSYITNLVSRVNLTFDEYVELKIREFKNMNFEEFEKIFIFKLLDYVGIKNEKITLEFMRKLDFKKMYKNGEYNLISLVADIGEEIKHNFPSYNIESRIGNILLK